MQVLCKLLVFAAPRWWKLVNAGLITNSVFCSVLFPLLFSSLRALRRTGSFQITWCWRHLATPRPTGTTIISAPHALTHKIFHYSGSWKQCLTVVFVCRHQICCRNEEEFPSRQLKEDYTSSTDNGLYGITFFANECLTRDNRMFSESLEVIDFSTMGRSED